MYIHTSQNTLLWYGVMYSIYVHKIVEDRQIRKTTHPPTLKPFIVIYITQYEGI